MRKLLVIAAVLAASLAVVARPADGATQQFTWFDQEVTHTASSYAEPTQSAATPASWNSPVNYAGGRVYVKFNVLEKPSTKPLDLQICVWRHGSTRYQYESCTYVKPRFTSTGVHWIDFGTPNTWWKMNGVWTWGSRFDVVRFMVKDPNTDKLMQTSRCGAYCSTEAAVAGHVPMRFDVAAVVVAAGATLLPPSDWAGCPSGWSPACTGSSGTTTTTRPTTSSTTTTTRPTTSSTTTTTRPTTSSTTTTTRPTTSSTTTTSTTIPPTSGTVALVVGNATTLPSKDVPIRNRLIALGRTVVLVDDDALGSTSALGGAALAVISSSVVPTKVPSWLATSATPILDLEAYAQKTLRLATSAKELASLTTVRMTNTGHPLAAGRTGDVAVQSSASMAAATPVKSAIVVARQPGATTASVYGIEKNAALTTGTAPARRVALFFSYDSPAKATSAGWAMFDAAVRWLAP